MFFAVGISKAKGCLEVHPSALADIWISHVQKKVLRGHVHGHHISVGSVSRGTPQLLGHVCVYMEQSLAGAAVPKRFEGQASAWKHFLLASVTCGANQKKTSWTLSDHIKRLLGCFTLEPSPFSLNRYFELDGFWMENNQKWCHKVNCASWSIVMLSFNKVQKKT